jgi:hypothetical protein
MRDGMINKAWMLSNRNQSPPLSGKRDGHDGDEGDSISNPRWQSRFLPSSSPRLHRTGIKIFALVIEWKKRTTGSRATSTSAQFKEVARKWRRTHVNTQAHMDEREGQDPGLVVGLDAS